MFKRILVILVVLFVFITLSACAGSKTENDESDNNQTTKQTNDQSSLNNETSEGGEQNNESGNTSNDSDTSENTTGEIAGSDDSSEEKDISGLKSYHSVLSLTLKSNTEDGDQTTRIEQYNVKEPPAKHMIYYTSVIDGEFQVMMEMIMIDTDSWFKFSDGSWSKQTDENSDESMFNENIFNREDIDNNSQKFVGNEKISGIDCKHYTFKVEVSNSSVEGDFWIANEKNIKNIVIKENVLSSGTVNDETTTTYLEYLMDQINENIEILPPEES